MSGGARRLEQCYKFAIVTLGSSLAAARTAARLSVGQLAALAGASEKHITEFEQGALTLDAHEVDACARALGLRFEDLSHWTGDERPLTLLMRESFEANVDVTAVLTPSVHMGLGEFQRTVRHIADLEARLSRHGSKLPLIDPVTKVVGGKRGEILADRTRRLLVAEGLLDIEAAPIRSMRKLVEEQLGIAVVWVTAEHLDPLVDGASTSAPRNAMLINLLEENRYPWRARATVAHELCHLLFDHRERRTLFSPRANGRSTAADEAIERLETVARAFSACLLAPSAGVQRTVGGLDPTSEEAICRVGETYGVGRTVAVNRLAQVFKLSRSQHSAMSARPPRHCAADFSGDDVPIVGGFRGDPLRSLVHDALAEGVLRPARAREILGLLATDELPFPDLGELCAPPVSRHEAMRRFAARAIRNDHPEEDLEAVDPKPTAGGFRVALVDRGGENRGWVDLGPAGEAMRVELKDAPGAP